MKYRKKPVVIEAFQMTRERRVDNSEWPHWLHRAWNTDRGEPGAVYPAGLDCTDGLLAISTLEGAMTVNWDDFIIQGVQGELYPCKPDIFDATYNRADDERPLGSEEHVSIEEANWVVGCVNGQVRVLKDRDGLCADVSMDDVTLLADIVLGRRFAGKRSDPFYVVLDGPGPHQEFVDCETAAGESVKVKVAAATKPGQARLGPFWDRPPFEPPMVKWRVEPDATLVLWDVFNGIGIETDQGRIGVAQRDSGIEVVLETPADRLSWSSTTAWGNDPQTTPPADPPTYTYSIFIGALAKGQHSIVLDNEKDWETLYEIVLGLKATGSHKQFDNYDSIVAAVRGEETG